MRPAARRIAKRTLWRYLPDLMLERQSSQNRWRWEWSIGIYTGDSPASLSAPAHMSNPVLTWREVTDVPAAFVADPFIVRAGSAWVMFFEVLNRATERGEIGFATSGNGMQWSYGGIVLAEPFHLSYPYMFEWQGDYYMMPEASRSGAIRLYRARRFPDCWDYVGNLLEGGRFADSSIFRHAERWWLYSDTGCESKSPILRLFYAPDLAGPWTEHPASPIVQSDPRVARPGGRVLVLEDQIIRFTQDSVPHYGSHVYAFEITNLTPTTYRERPLATSPLLASGGAEWNRDGMHHVDAQQLVDGSWVAAVDGFQWRQNAGD